MKDSKQIRKIVFISNSYVALVLFNKFEDENNILFANQLSATPTDLRVKLNSLLTDAANFTGFNIKDVEVVFDDTEIAKISYADQEFVDCNNEEDITKEIYKKARIDNYYVNEINWSKIEYDEIDKKAIVNCEVCASNYTTYMQFVKTVNSCNLMVTNSTNLYTLLNSNKCNSELVLNIVNGQIYCSKYFDNKLSNIVKLDCSYATIKHKLAQRFNCDINKVNSMAALANSINNVDDYDINLSLTYNVKARSISTIKNKEFVAAYQEELFNQINDIVTLGNYKKIRIISSSALDKLANTDFITSNDVIGLETISPDKIISLNNIDKNNNILTHFNFENNISTKLNAEQVVA